MCATFRGCRSLASAIDQSAIDWADFVGGLGYKVEPLTTWR